MKKVSRYFKRLLCKHESLNLIRWCIKHIPDYEPSCVVVEYECEDCGKFVYTYLKEKNKSNWLETMGEHKHEDFYCTR